MTAAVFEVSGVAVAPAVAAEIDAAKTLWKRPQIASDEAAFEKAAFEKAASEKAASEKAASEKAASEIAVASSRILVAGDVDQLVAVVQGVTNSLLQLARQHEAASARATLYAVQFGELAALALVDSGLVADAAMVWPSIRRSATACRNLHGSWAKKLPRSWHAEHSLP